MLREERKQNCIHPLSIFGFNYKSSATFFDLFKMKNWIKYFTFDLNLIIAMHLLMHYVENNRFKKVKYNEWVLSNNYLISNYSIYLLDFGS